MNEVLERLLQAQLEHELARFGDEQLAHEVTAGVAQLFAWFETVTLDEVVTREQINGVITRYAVELRVSGGITELTGELARLVLHSARSASTRVDQILAPASYEEFAEKLTALEGVRRELIALVAHSTTFAALNARMLARSLLDMLTPQLLRSNGMLGASLSKLWEPVSRAFRPDAERLLADLVGHYLEQHRDQVTQGLEKRLLQVLSPTRVRSLLDEVWDSVAAMPLSEAFAVIGEHDLEDFVVLVHEFWLRYRKTEFFRGISTEMVDHFFRKYGQETLASLVTDMGVSQSMVRDELLGFLRPLAQHALRSGALEQALRARLADFYGSEAAHAALAPAQLTRPKGHLEE